MVKQITIDSSIIVAALLDKEKYHNECRNLLEKVKNGAHQAADIAKEIGVRGMDAIVIQTAKEFDIPLVSLDREMLERSKSIIGTKNVEEL